MFMHNNPLLRNNRLIAHLSLFILSSLFFVYFYEIDIIVSAFFYDPVINDFSDEAYFSITYYRRELLFILKIFYAAFFLFFLFQASVYKNIIALKKTLILFLNAMLGPVLIVNVLFKNQFGRARPESLLEFGQSSTFTPAYYMSDQCVTNCSFSCGDATVGFMFFALAFIFPRHFYKWIFFALALGGIFGFMRLIMGKHFLSDVIVSGYVCFFVAVVTYWLISRLFEKKQAKLG